MVSDKKIRRIKSMQSEILARVLSEKEMQEIYAKYLKGSRRNYTRRHDNFERPLTRLEKDCIREFMLTEKSIAAIAEDLKMTNYTFIHKVKKALEKLVYQNREKLDLEKLLSGEGGEQD